jgi:hypothetical protein
MGTLILNERVIDAKLGQPIWYQTINDLQDQIKDVWENRPIKYDFLHPNFSPSWHHDTLLYYLYATANGAEYFCPITLPVGAMITDIEVRISAPAVTAGGTIDFYENRQGGGNVTTINIDGGAANPWQNGADNSYGNSTPYTAVAMNIVIKPQHYYFIHFEAGNGLGAGANEARIWKVHVYAQLCEH